MAHKMGLAKITRGSKTGVYNEKYYLTGEKSTYNWVHNSGTSTVYSSTTFTNKTNKPYVTSNICYYIVKGTATISSDNEFPTDDNGNGWTISSSTLGTIAEGNIVEKTSPNPTLTAKTWTAYTLTIGDVYYSDGALTHNGGTAYSSRTKAGLVIHVFDSSGSPATGESSWRHGWVMSYADASTAAYWCSAAKTYNHPTNEDVRSSRQAIINDKNGYYKTGLITAAGNSTDYPAAWAAKNYSQTVPSSTSGWYLPSVGQWWTLVYNLAGIRLTSITSSAGDITYLQWANNTPFEDINGAYSLNLSTTGNYYSSCTEVYPWDMSSYGYSGNTSCFMVRPDAIDEGSTAYFPKRTLQRVRPMLTF